MTPLCELAAKYGTDKLGVYTPFYDLLLRDRRESVKRVLEIGIGTPETMPHVKGYKAGASLRMWRDYFPKATVIGLDSNPHALLSEDRIGSYIADQSDKRHLDAALGDWAFDLIVDDGSHSPEYQLAAFDSLKHRLIKGGLYVIEDVERYALEQNLLSPHLPEHTVIQHHHGKEVGRCILIRG